MIKRFSDFKTELRENMRGGDGVVVINNFVTAEEVDLYDGEIITAEEFLEL